MITIVLAGMIVLLGLAWLYTYVKLIELSQWTHKYFANANRRINRLQEAVLLIAQEAHIPVTVEKEEEESPSDSLPITGHTLIVGRSGSGKSNAAMVEIINRLKAGQELYLIDTKAELYPIFGQYAKRVVRTVADTGMMDEEEVRSVFTELLKEAAERREMFNAAAEQRQQVIRDLPEYQSITGHHLPVICLVLEELVVLSSYIDLAELIQLLVLGRSSGIYVFAMSQYLTREILDRKGSINFTTRVFLGKWDEYSTRNLFGNVRKAIAEKLELWVGPPGRAAVEIDGQPIVEMQIPRVDRDVLNTYVRGEK